MVLTVDFGEDVASICRSAFDFAAFFDFETLHGTLDAFHLGHMLTPA
jgi:hypothetical protein